MLVLSNIIDLSYPHVHRFQQMNSYKVNLASIIFIKNVYSMIFVEIVCMIYRQLNRVCSSLHPTYFYTVHMMQSNTLITTDLIDFIIITETVENNILTLSLHKTLYSVPKDLKRLNALEFKIYLKIFPDLRVVSCELNK